MKKSLTILAAVCSSIIMFPSCDWVSSIVHEGDVVAKAGAHKLYDTDIKAVIPSGLSPADSTALALQYINRWATEQLYQDIALKELDKADKDVSKELEDYRRALLKFRYEQSYINQRLDTTITETQVQKYFDTHKEQFTLQSPVIKARFAVIGAKSPYISQIRNYVSSDDDDGFESVDTLAVVSTLRYVDFGGRWVDASVVAREFGMDAQAFLSARRNGFVEKVDDSGNALIAYVRDIVQGGQTGPVEYYVDRIKDIILSTRKQALLSSLEEDLLKQAKASGEFEIY